MKNDDKDMVRIGLPAWSGLVDSSSWSASEWEENKGEG